MSQLNKERDGFDMDIKFKGPLENICETCNHKNLQIETHELYGYCFEVSQEIEVK